MIFIKFICLILAITYGFVCFGRLYRKLEIKTGQIILMAIGIAGFITLQWII